MFSSELPCFNRIGQLSSHVIADIEAEGSTQLKHWNLLCALTREGHNALATLHLTAANATAADAVE
jgi:hypothetical protein